MLLRPRARLGLEVLADRITPATFDVNVFTARPDSPFLVRFNFFMNEAAVVPVGVYRSADRTFDAGDQLVGSGTILPTFDRGGFASSFAVLNGQLPLDPARDFVLVVADPNNQFDETIETNNVAVFRKIAVAAVTHGFSVTGDPSTYLVPLAQSIQAEGYDFAFPFLWTPFSQIPTPDGAVNAGRTLAQFVRNVATVLAGPGDVVDVHLIGHSRGTAVVSQAFQSLTLDPGPRSLQLGYFKQTLLDPHVARNFAPIEFGYLELLSSSGAVGTSQVAQVSFNPSSQFAQGFVLATLAFQASALDPLPFVPTAVDEAEVYFQRLAWNETTFVIPGFATTAEQLIGVNFLGYPVASFSFAPVRYIDLGPQGVGHYEVPEWYQFNVVPTLGG